MIDNLTRAQILIEALPYMQHFTGKTVVIKYGGNAMTDPALVDGLLQDIALLRCIGIRAVVVHGGGPEISKMLSQLEIPSNFHNGLRITDADTMRVVQMSLAGKMNKDIVARLTCLGAPAIGLCGKDAGLLQCVKVVSPDGVDLGYVGEVVKVNSDLIDNLCNAGYTPVIAPVGVGENGESYNINADTAAGAVAGALRAEKLIYLTDIDGVRTDPADPATLLPQLSVGEVGGLIANGTISGGMIPKVQSCVDAALRGVRRVHIISGTTPHAILLEMLTKTGVGTMVYTESGEH